MLTLLFLIGRGYYQIGKMNYKEKKMNRDLDGIYLRIKRDDKWQSICLSDMAREELENNLNSERGEWLKGAVIHLALTLHDIGEQFNIRREE